MYIHESGLFRELMGPFAFLSHTKSAVSKGHYLVRPSVLAFNKHLVPKHRLPNYVTC